ncbi:MAG: hypothetical protein WC497_00410 [Patescibacteria group bacterium]
MVGKLIRNLLQKKIFYFGIVAIILGLSFCHHAFIHSTHAAPACSSYQVCSSPQWNEGPHIFYSVTPESLIMGNHVVELRVDNCNFHEPSDPPDSGFNRYVLRRDGGTSEDGNDIESTYGYQAGQYLYLGFDLTGVGAGYYSLIHYYSTMTHCNPDTWSPGKDNLELPDPPYEYHDLISDDYAPKKTYGRKILVYSPAIVGWGWFGAATPGDTSCRDSRGQPYPCGSPAWMSLNCMSDTIGGTSRNRCYDAVENPTGIDYGLSLFYDMDHFRIRGQAWLGIHSDNDSNPANNTGIGWTNFDPTIDQGNPYSAVPTLAGTTVAQASYNEDTGAVYGWARIQTLQEEGTNTRCSTMARDWSGVPISLLGSLNGLSGHLVEAPDHTLHATWVGPGPDQSVYYDYQTAGLWLTNPVNLSNIAGGEIGNSVPDISVESDGTVYVSYIHQGTDIRLFSCSSSCDDSANWSFTDAVTGVVGLADQVLATTKDISRTIYVFYQVNGDVFIITSQDGSAWTVPENISDSGTASWPRLAVDFQDNIHVVWQDGSNIYYRKYTNGSGWSPDLSSPGTQVNVLGASAHPAIAVDPEANPHIAYETAPNIVYRKHTPIGGWYSEIQVTSGTNDTNPIIAYGNDYRAHVLYLDNAHVPNKKILYSESTNGKDWSTPNPIYDENTVDQLSPDAIVTKNNYVQALFSRPGDVIHQTVSTGVYGDSCTAPSPTDVSGTDWGWVSLRGGLGMCGATQCATPQDYADVLETIGPGFRGCYACDETAKSCKICEIIDQDYGAPNMTTPPRYACNVCTSCGKCDNQPTISCYDDTPCNGGSCVINSKCSRTGVACDQDNPCEWTEGEKNECVPACASCDSCNIWGVSIDGDLATGANFHGYAWSAGGTVDITGQPGSYNSGDTDSAYNLTLAGSCSSANDCVAGGWVINSPANPNFNTASQLCGKDADFGLGGGTLNGWGACQVRGPGASTKYFTKDLPASITQAGNYFLSLKAVYDTSVNENVVVEILDNATDGNVINTLTSADLNNAGKAVKTCTFSNEVYLEPGNLLRFTSVNDVDIEIDSFQITSLPVSNVNCELNNELTEVYVDEVGFGFMDYSNVSTLDPWIQTQYGNIYSGGAVGPGGGAPAGAMNSTYIIGTAEGAGIDSSWIAPIIREGTETTFGLPSPEHNYRNPLGKIPYAELSKSAGSNPYSDRVIEFNKDTLPDCQPNGSIYWSEVKNTVIPPNGKGPLRKGIYHFGRSNEACNLVIDQEMELENGNNENGSGTFLIEGDLVVDANISVKETGNQIDVISELASAGFIVKGNVKIKGSVTEIVGAYAVIGCDDAGGNCQGDPLSHVGLFDTAYDTDASTDQFKLYGVVIAYRYDFGRKYSGLEGAEVFTNNGVLQANPPPGFVNISTATKISAERPFTTP